MRTCGERSRSASADQIIIGCAKAFEGPQPMQPHPRILMRHRQRAHGGYDGGRCRRDEPSLRRVAPVAVGMRQQRDPAREVTRRDGRWRAERPAVMDDAVDPAHAVKRLLQLPVDDLVTEEGRQEDVAFDDAAIHVGDVERAIRARGS